MKTVKVSCKVHNILANALKKHLKNEKYYPHCFMLGKNKKGIVAEALTVRNVPGDGCNEMPYLQVSSLAQRMIDIYKKEAIPCGLARVGSFKLENSKLFGDRGYSLLEVNGFIISMTKEGAKVEKSICRTRDIEDLCYAVVNPNKKEVIKNG